MNDIKDRRCSAYIATDSHMINGKCKNGFPVNPGCYWDAKLSKPFCMYEEFPKNLQWIGEMINDKYSPKARNHNHRGRG